MSLLLRGAAPAVVLRAARSAEEYGEALAAGRGATVFHQWSWLHFWARASGASAHPLVALAGGRLVGAVPVLVAARGPVRVCAPLPFPYLGPAVAPGELGGALDALGRWAARRGLPRVVLGSRAVGGEDLAALRRRGFTPVLEDTFEVPLVSSDPEEQLASLPGRTRTNVRAGRRAGVVVRDARREDLERVLPLVHAESFAQHGARNPYRADVGVRCWDELVADPPPGPLRAVPLAAELDGECVGVVVALHDGVGAHLWTGGCLQAVRDARANHVLHLAAMVRAAELGYSQLDLVASVDRGVAEFKARMGGVPSPFLAASGHSSRSWAVLAGVARRGRHLAPLRAPAPA